MSAPDLEPLDPELARLLEHERQRPPVSPATHDQLFSRVSSSLATAAAIGGVASAGAAAKAAATKTWLVALSAFAVGSALGAGAMLLRSSPEPKTITVERRIEVPVPVTVVVSAPATPPSIAPSATVAPPVTAPPKPGSDAAEQLALEKIRSALKSGDSAAALAAVVEHEKKYPAGAHAEEREALAVQALARAGRTADAKARAERFHQRFPGSFFTSIVDNAAGAKP
jgi:hypothetical protein